MCMGGGGSPKVEVPKPPPLPPPFQRPPPPKPAPTPPKKLVAPDAKPDIRIGDAKKPAGLVGTEASSGSQWFWW